jgi:hypothetical protein
MFNQIGTFVSRCQDLETQLATIENSLAVARTPEAVSLAESQLKMVNDRIHVLGVQLKADMAAPADLKTQYGDLKSHRNRLESTISSVRERILNQPLPVPGPALLPDVPQVQLPLESNDLKKFRAMVFKKELTGIQGMNNFLAFGDLVEKSIKKQKIHPYGYYHGYRQPPQTAEDIEANLKQIKIIETATLALKEAYNEYLTLGQKEGWHDAGRYAIYETHFKFLLRGVTTGYVSDRNVAMAIAAVKSVCSHCPPEFKSSLIKEAISAWKHRDALFVHWHERDHYEEFAKALKEWASQANPAEERKQ